MTNLDPNPPPTGPRSRPVASRPQTMWLIAGAIVVLLILGYFVSNEQTSVTPPAPEATAPADTTPPADTGATAPAPAPAPETATPPATAPSDTGTTGTGTGTGTTTAPATPPATSP